MVDVSARKNPKGTNTKKDKEDMMPKTIFFSKVTQVTPTIGIVNMVKLKGMIVVMMDQVAKFL